MAEGVPTVPPELTHPVLSSLQLKEVQANRLCWWLLRGQGNLVACCKAFVWSEGLAGNSRHVWGGAECREGPSLEP